jgi:hypothetical protein
LVHSLGLIRAPFIALVIAIGHCLIAVLCIAISMAHYRLLLNRGNKHHGSRRLWPTSLCQHVLLVFGLLRSFPKDRFFVIGSSKSMRFSF